LYMDPPTQAELDAWASLAPAATAPLIRGDVFYDQDVAGSRTPAAFLVPRRPPHQRLQRDCKKARPHSIMFMAEGGDSLRGFSIDHSMAARPIFVKVRSAVCYQHNPKPSPVWEANIRGPQLRGSTLYLRQGLEGK